MKIFQLFTSKVLVVALASVLGASLVWADQNDRKDNRGNGQSSGSSNGPPARSFSSGNSGNAGNSGNSGGAGPSFSGRNNFSGSNNFGNSNSGDVIRSFQSQGDQGSRGRFSSDSGGQSQGSNFRSSDSRSSGSSASSSSSAGGGDGSVGSSLSSRSTSRSTVLGQQIQSGNTQNNSSQNNNQKGTSSSNQASGSSQTSGTNQSNINVNRNFSQFRGNDTARIADNDDHKNKGDNNRNNGGNNNNKGNNGQNNQGQSNQGQNNSGQNNKGQNSSDGQNRDSGKHLGDNPTSKTGVPFTGKSNDTLPGSNNGTKFDPKNSDFKNGDRGDKNFKFGDHRNDNLDKNHDGKPDNQVTVKDLFDHKVGDGHSNPNSNRVFHDRDFHGKDSDKAAFNKWNDVWKGKNGGGKDNRDWSGKWRTGDRFVTADAIRHDFFSIHDPQHGHDVHSMPFQASWWDSHHGHDHDWAFWGDYASHHHHNSWWWWSWASAPVLATYCNFGWGTPYYWDYGQGEYIYCNGGNVYVNGRLYEPAPVYYAQTVRLIDQAPLLNPDDAADADWMPLGVFAVTPDGANQPLVIMQLAITKNGIIGGTASDQQAGASYHVDGTVDQKTQRAVWSYMDGGSNRIVMESSINNLTQNESTGLIHFGPNDQRVVEFVRMPEPNAQGELPMPQEVGMPADDGPSLPPPEQ